ncbi:hypothetical protein ACTFIW_006271 [Dictyostelium discoideum]
MKFLAVLCIFLFTFVFAYGCTNNPCGTKDVSVTSNGSCMCVKASDFSEVYVDTTKLSEMTVGVTLFSRYGVQVHNNGNSAATNILMGLGQNIIDQSFDISSDTEISLNVQTNSVQFQRIEKNNSSGFNFTMLGRNQPQIFIKSVEFSN